MMLSGLFSSHISRYINISIAIICVYSGTLHAYLTNNNKSDPYPIFKTLDPELFLSMRDRIELKDPRYVLCKKEHAAFSLSPFASNAETCRNYFGQGFLPANQIPDPAFFNPDGTACPPQTCVFLPIEIGDMLGRVNMIGLLTGNTPAGQQLVPSLQTAYNQIFPDGSPVASQYYDPNQLYSCFTAPIKHRKRGLRTSVAVMITSQIGCMLETGFANISRAVNLLNLTCSAKNECSFLVPDVEVTNKVNQYLMGNVDTIAQQLGVSIGDSSCMSWEDVRMYLFWRNMYEMNGGECYKALYPHYAFMPFFMIGGSVSPGKKLGRGDIFGAPFGNNGHGSFGGSAGFDFDFFETIELSAEVGITEFFGRTICTGVPTSPYQFTMFPYFAQVHVEPGLNWHFCGKMSAYHFLDNLSLYFQYIMLEHKKDKISLITPDPAFLPKVLEERSPFKAKLINVAMNYDLSPNTTVGFLWQIPISQRSTYKTTTLMFSFNATF